MRCIFILAIGAGLLPGVLAQPKPVPELAKFEYLVGEWHGSFGPMKGVLVNEWVENGRFLKSTLNLSGAEGPFTETSFLGWDPKKRKYRAWNFNAMSALPRIEEGTLEGEELVLISEPWDAGPMAVVSKGTTRRINETEVTVKVEVRQGDRWLPMYTGTFRKVIGRAGKAKIASKGTPPPF